MIVIGSTAIKFWMPTFPRDPSDQDCVVVEGTPVIKGWDCHEVPIGIYDTLLKYSRGGMLTPYGWYLLKASHLGFDTPNWVKHAKDIIWFQNERILSAKIEYAEDMFDSLHLFWQKFHKQDKSKINLNKPVEEFFNSNVPRIYNHDDLHEAVKYDKIPGYKKISANDGTANVLETKWNLLSDREKLENIFEETYVIALERYLLTGKVKDSTMAYRMAMKDLITRMSTGWWTKWYIENLYRLYTPEINYQALFETKRNKLEMII